MPFAAGPGGGWEIDGAPVCGAWYRPLSPGREGKASMNGKLTRVFCAAAAGIALAASGLAGAGAARTGHADPPGSRVPVTAYVANFSPFGSGDTVTPIRTATRTALKAITVGTDPIAIAITPDGGTAYVVNGGGTVTPIATATNTALPDIKVGADPDAIAITPNGKTAYVANLVSFGTRAR